MEESNGATKRDPTPPFAPFFALAALDAIVAVGIWPLALAGVSFPPALDLAVWHGREMLFGYLGASLAGFFFTALPRWTGRPVPAWAVRLVLVLWLAARLAPSSGAFAFLAAAPVVALASVVSFQIVAARDRRDFKLAALLWLYAASGMVVADPAAGPARDFALRLAIVALASLVMIIGGRVVPALTQRFDALCGETPPTAASSRLEGLSLICAAAGLIFWLVRPEGGAVAAALLAGAAGQALRLASWSGRSTAASPPLWGFYAAYAMFPFGFVLLAGSALSPDAIPQSAGLHVLMVGGFGGMCLAVKSSMIRRRNNLSFAMSSVGIATALFWFGAACLRPAASFSGAPDVWLMAAALAWATSFVLFLFDFRVPLSGGVVTR